MTKQISSSSKSLLFQQQTLLTKSQQLQALQLIFNHIHDGACVTDAEGIVTHFNEPYGRFLEVDPKEQIGKHITEVVENTRMHIVARPAKQRPMPVSQYRARICWSTGFQSRKTAK